MSRAMLIIRSDLDRERACRWAHQAPAGTRVEFKETRRTNPQNSRMWAMLTDVATQVKWYGMNLTPTDWKLIFLEGLKRELRVVPNLDGTGFVNLGRSSADLSKQEMSDMIELITAFGANHGVIFQEDSC